MSAASLALRAGLALSLGLSFVGALGSEGCRSTGATTSPDGGAVPCVDLAESDAYACAEAQFWPAFRAPGLAARQASESEIEAVIARFPSPTDDVGASLMRFRLGQIRLAMALENAQKTYVLNAGTDIIAEFDDAMSLNSYGGIIAPWKDAMQIASAAAVDDWTDAVPLAQTGFQNIALNPMGNTLSLSGTTIGFPLSTNVPQTTISYLDSWQCTGVAWCTANTAHAPFARPGLGYHFAEAYARVGDRDKAVQYLAQAAAAPDYDVWPYRSIAETSRTDVDAFLAKFANVGPDGSAFEISYANQTYGCLFCHAAGPASAGD